MKFNVQTQGTVLARRQKVYKIEADSREEAEREARTRFEKEFTVAEGTSVSAKGSQITICNYIAMAALIIADVLALIGFRSESFMNNQVIRPDLQSVLYGAGIYLVLLFKMKGLTNTFKDWVDIVLALLMSILFGSFLQLLVAKMPFAGFFSMVKLDIRIFVLALAVIAWLGSGILSLICLAAIGSLIFYSITHLGPVMLNVKGILYMAASLIGIAAYVYALPAFRQGIMELKAIFSRK